MTQLFPSAPQLAVPSMDMANPQNPRIPTTSYNLPPIESEVEEPIVEEPEVEMSVHFPKITRDEEVKLVNFTKKNNPTLKSREELIEKVKENYKALFIDREGGVEPQQNQPEGIGPADTLKQEQEVIQEPEGSQITPMEIPEHMQGKLPPDFNTRPESLQQKVIAHGDIPGERDLDEAELSFLREGGKIPEETSFAGAMEELSKIGWGVHLPTSGPDSLLKKADIGQNIDNLLKDPKFKDVAMIIGKTLRNTPLNTYDLAAHLTNAAINPGEFVADVMTLGKGSMDVIAGATGIMMRDDKLAAPGASDLLEDRYNTPEAMMVTALAENLVEHLTDEEDKTFLERFGTYAKGLAEFALENPLDAALIVAPSATMGKIGATLDTTANAIKNFKTFVTEGVAGPHGNSALRKASGFSTSKTKNRKQIIPKQDKSSELILESGRQPTDTSTRAIAHEETMYERLNEYKSYIPEGDANGLFVDFGKVADDIEAYIANNKHYADNLKTKNQMELLQEQANAFREAGKKDLVYSQKQLSTMNAETKWGDNADFGDAYNAGIKEGASNIRGQLDSQLSKTFDVKTGKGDFQIAKDNFGALAETYDDVYTAYLKTMKDKGQSIQSVYSRVRGGGKLIKGILAPIRGENPLPFLIEGTAEVLLGERLGQLRDPDWLVGKGFRDLARDAGLVGKTRKVTQGARQAGVQLSAERNIQGRIGGVQDDIAGQKKALPDRSQETGVISPDGTIKDPGAQRHGIDPAPPRATDIKELDLRTEWVKRQDLEKRGAIVKQQVERYMESRIISQEKGEEMLSKIDEMFGAEITAEQKATSFSEADKAKLAGDDLPFNKAGTAESANVVKPRTVKGKVVANLSEESKKYKSADEFVKQWSEENLPKDFSGLKQRKSVGISSVDIKNLRLDSRYMKNGKRTDEGKKFFEQQANHYDDMTIDEILEKPILVGDGFPKDMVRDGNHRLVALQNKGYDGRISVIKTDGSGTKLSDIREKANNPTLKKKPVVRDEKTIAREQSEKQIKKEMGLDTKEFRVIKRKIEARNNRLKDGRIDSKQFEKYLERATEEVMELMGVDQFQAKDIIDSLL